MSEEQQQGFAVDSLVEMRRECVRDPLLPLYGMFPRIVDVIPGFVTFGTPYIHRQPICCDKENGSVNE